jgi:hypothetical protein
MLSGGKMFQSIDAIALISQYQLGERNFQKIQMRRADLRGLDLKGVDLSGADLSYANLREADLRGANLSDACLNEIDLTGANLAGANLNGTSLLKAYLIKTNLQGANLSQALLTGTYLTKANLKQANLSGAYLNGSKLTGADLTNAYYDQATTFDVSFKPEKLGMVTDSIKSIFTSKKPAKITLGNILDMLNYLNEKSDHYLGHTMSNRCWHTTRPNYEWLSNFQISPSKFFIFVGETGEINPEQLQWLEIWVNNFVESCGHIIQNFALMIDLEKCVVPIYSAKPLNPPSNLTNSRLSPSKSPEASHLVTMS